MLHAFPIHLVFSNVTHTYKIIEDLLLLCIFLCNFYRLELNLSLKSLCTALFSTVMQTSAFLEQQDDSDSSPLPSSGQKVSYQTDPRPHFGVAWSSHSPCHPLWGSEGPCRGQRNQEVHYQTHTCPHCHLDLPPDTLRWHEVWLS